MRLDNSINTASADNMTDDLGFDCIEELALKLKEQGGFIFQTELGRIVVTDIKWLVHKPAILIACEGGGGVLFEFDRPLNAFRLMSKGFPGPVAKDTADLINSLFYRQAPEVLIEGK